MPKLLVQAGQIGRKSDSNLRQLYLLDLSLSLSVAADDCGRPSQSGRRPLEDGCCDPWFADFLLGARRYIRANASEIKNLPIPRGQTHICESAQKSGAGRNVSQRIPASYIPFQRHCYEPIYLRLPNPRGAKPAISASTIIQSWMLIFSPLLFHAALWLAGKGLIALDNINQSTATVTSLDLLISSLRGRASSCATSLPT